MSHPKGTTTHPSSNPPEEGDLAYDLERDEVGVVVDITENPQVSAWDNRDLLVTLQHNDDRWSVDLLHQPDRLMEAHSAATIGEMADALGLDAIDFAIPKWFADHLREMGFSAAHFVWDYSSGTMGRPRPLSTEARGALGAYNDKHGTDYPTDDTVLYRVDEFRFATYYITA